MVPRPIKGGRGFTILELIMAMGVFLVICAAMFELLQMSQRKYSNESQLSGSFQEARLAVDQIVRDVNIAGYPPLSLYSGSPSSPAVNAYAFSPLAWSPNYPASSCSLGTAGGGTCATPGDFDLIVETRLGMDFFVSWVWYHFDPAKLILYRTVVQKTAGDPLSAVTSAGTSTPFLKNVMNIPGAQPIFQFTCDTATGPQPCASASPNNIPRNIRDVDVTLIVATPQPDMQTHSNMQVELHGRGHLSNRGN